MNFQQRLEKLHRHIEQETLVRGEWGDGYQRACLLAALAPEVVFEDYDGEDEGNPDLCPASVMPAWLAHLTPWMDDYGSKEAWPGMVQRFAGLAGRWHVLGPKTWRRLEFTARKLILETCRDRAPAVCDPIVVFYDQEIEGDPLSDEEWARISSLSQDAAKLWFDQQKDESRKLSWGCRPPSSSEAVSLYFGMDHFAESVDSEATTDIARNVFDAAPDSSCAVDKFTTDLFDAIEAEIEKAEAE